jgi:chorismate mutase/prephenate dehydratase
MNASTPETHEAALARVRAEIEQIDASMVGLMARRVELARQTGTLKRAAGTFTLDPEREAAVIRRAAALARQAAIDEEAVRAVFWQIIGMARRAQQEG